MSAQAAFATCSWRVGYRTVTLTLPRPKPGQPVFLTCEWAPNDPSRLSTAEWAEYRAGRAHALARVAAELGISVALLEL